MDSSGARGHSTKVFRFIVPARGRTIYAAINHEARPVLFGGLKNLKKKSIFRARSKYLDRMSDFALAFLRFSNKFPRSRLHADVFRGLWCYRLVGAMNSQKDCLLSGKLIQKKRFRQVKSPHSCLQLCMRWKPFENKRRAEPIFVARWSIHSIMCHF